MPSSVSFVIAARPDRRQDEQHRIRSRTGGKGRRARQRLHAPSARSSASKPASRRHDAQRTMTSQPMPNSKQASASRPQREHVPAPTNSEASSTGASKSENCTPRSEKVRIRAGRLTYQVSAAPAERTRGRRLLQTGVRRHASVVGCDGWAERLLRRLREGPPYSGSADLQYLGCPRRTLVR